MKKIYTIGFTQKSAEVFFELLIKNDINVLLDIRLNNTSQLAAFSKYPDIEYFLMRICGIAYKHDTLFTPTEDILTDFKKKQITWEQYVYSFENIMLERNVKKHITENYLSNKNICLLCSEPKPNQCHRSLVANMFVELDKSFEIVNL